MKNNKEFLLDLGMKIRIHRTMKGLTMKDIADRTGFEKSAINGIELGKKNCHILTLKAIAEALGMGVIELMCYPKE